MQIAEGTYGQESGLSVNFYSPFLTRFSHYKKYPGTEQFAVDAMGGDSEGNIWTDLGWKAETWLYEFKS